ncbi:MAG: Tm-1-like ATP-binding domain-containing protein, partial [Nocardioidaceae bacterium]|nr:Tm-1-like ATP-binding domain-containing protein [Nocardioidaceae bacterium]
MRPSTGRGATQSRPSRTPRAVRRAVERTSLSISSWWLRLDHLVQTVRHRQGELLVVDGQVELLDLDLCQGLGQPSQQCFVGSRVVERLSLDSDHRDAAAGDEQRRRAGRCGQLSTDLTATELADELVGGVLAAGPDRLTAAGAAGLPQVVSLGALDMVNFGPRETVPSQFEGRNLYVHNPTVTLMRTSPEECRELGREVGRKLSAAKGPT